MKNIFIVKEEFFEHFDRKNIKNIRIKYNLSKFTNPKSEEIRILRNK